MELCIELPNYDCAAVDNCKNKTIKLSPVDKA